MIYPDNPRHYDEYIDDPASPEPLRVFLSRARQPAHGLRQQARALIAPRR